MKTETKFIPLVVCVIIAGIFWFLPVPEGVEPSGVRLLGIFLATIVGIVTKVLPMGGVALLGLTATVLTKTLSFEAAFAGFDNKVVWLIVAAFFLARGFMKTGLGNRIGFIFVRLLGKRSIGLGYGMLATELILSPAIPSNTARTGGVIFPIMESLAHSFGSDPDMGTARRLGSYLTMVAAQGTTITSAFFLTAMAANPLIVSFAEAQGVALSWGTWALAALVPAVIMLLIMPWILYKLYPPSVKSTPDAPEIARKSLHEMGPMKGTEWIMLFTFLGLIVLWVLSSTINVSATASALLGLCVLLVLGVLTWKDILSEHGAWSTLFWFATLIAMANNLKTLGMITWLGGIISGAVSGLSWPAGLLLLVLVYFYIHYFFVSMLAHVVTLFPVFLSVGIGLGAPPALVVLMLAFSSSLNGVLTQYSSGPAAILYGSNFVPLGRWWQLSFFFSVINFIVWIGLGTLWWKVLGLW